MKVNQLIKHSKEKFVAPRVTMSVGLEFEDVILVGSEGPEMAPVQTMGQEVQDYDSAYFEGNWN